MPPISLLDDVLVTEALDQRAASQMLIGSPRTPNLQAENQAFQLLARQLSAQPQTILKTLVVVAKDLCQAGSAGISLLEVTSDGEEIFRWSTISGALQAYEQGTTPRNFSPSGMCLDRQSPQLFSYPERYFTCLQDVKPTIVEELVIPLVAANQHLGTIWIVSHDQARQFDAEDVRIMTSLADFTTAALQSIHLRQTVESALQHEHTAYQAAESSLVERKRMEAALHESQTRMQTMLANMPGMVYRYVPFPGPPRFTFVSSGCRDLFEVEPETALQHANSVWNLIHPDDRPFFEASVSTAIEHLQDWDWSGRFILPSGQLKWIQGRSRILHTADGLAWDGFLFDATERKQAEDAVRESEEFNRSIFESSTDCIKVLDLDGRLLSMNSPGRCLLELEDCTPLLGTIWADFWQDPYREAADNAVNMAKSGEIGRFSGYCPTAKGTPKWWDVVVTPILDVEGKPKRLLVTSRDITESRRTEAALRQSESRFRLIVESVKDYAIFTLDLNGTITSWNTGAERLLGYQEEEIIGCHSRITFTPEDNESGQAEQEILTALTQERAEDERWHIRKDGSRFFASGLMTQLHDEAGNLQGLVKILRDMTEARQAAKRDQFLSEASTVLAESIDYKTTLFNIARLAVPFLADFCFFDIINANHQIERVAWHHGNPAKRDWFEQLQHYTPPQDHESHPITKVLISGNANLVSHVTDAWMQTVALSADHLQFIQESQVRSLITVPLIAHGRTLGALTVCLTAESNRHYTQADLAVAEELGHRAALALDNARLYQQAQEANRIKDEFLAVLSHELRSPLNPILGWVQLIQKGNLDKARTAQALATIERNARLQAQLIEDLLDVSRILRGKLSLTSAPVNLAAVSRAAIETVQLAAQAKAIEIQVSLDSDAEYVSGDATRLQQVVWNLLSNAVKFTPEGGRVNVKLDRVIGNDSLLVSQDSQQPPIFHPSSSTIQYAQITVSDSGVGIHPNFLPHVFDYFRQADSATTRKFGGLGLGLAIVRQIVEAHGGIVFAESPGEGLGATFMVRLPLMPVQPAMHSNHQSLAPSPSLQGTRILVVDNEPDTLEFVTVLLQQAGVSVITATSATEALAALMQAKPDVLLSDIGMPDMDGYMLMQKVRRLPPEQGGQVPAIALTAYASDTDCQRALRVGFQQHLSKPVEPEKLVRAIADLVKQNKHQ